MRKGREELVSEPLTPSLVSEATADLPSSLASIILPL